MGPQCWELGPGLAELGPCPSGPRLPESAQDAAKIRMADCCRPKTSCWGISPNAGNSLQGGRERGALGVGGDVQRNVNGPEIFHRLLPGGREGVASAGH